MKEKKSLEEIINISKTDDDIVGNLETYDLNLSLDRLGNSVLHQLVDMRLSNSRCVEVLNYLFEKKYTLDVNAKNRRGQTAFFLAIKNYRFRFAEILIFKGADVKVNQGVDNNIFNHENIFFIFASLYKNCKDDFKLLNAIDSLTQTIFFKCDINQEDSNGNNFLQQSILDSWDTLVQYFAKFSTDIDYLNKDGLSALEIAAKYEWLDVMLLLLNKGAKIFKTIKFSNGRTFDSPQEIFSHALFCAVEKNDVNKVQQILKCISSSTNIEELLSEIKRGIGLDRARLIEFCNTRLADKNEVNNSENLRLLKSTLYQLIPNSLVNRCLNTLNQEKARFFRQAAITEANLLPVHFKQALNPDVDEIVREKVVP